MRAAAAEQLWTAQLCRVNDGWLCRVKREPLETTECESGEWPSE